VHLSVRNAAHQIGIFDAEPVISCLDLQNRLVHIGHELRAWNVETRAERLAASGSMLCIDRFLKTERFNAHDIL